MPAIMQTYRIIPIHRSTRSNDRLRPIQRRRMTMTINSTPALSHTSPSLPLFYTPTPTTTFPTKTLPLSIIRTQTLKMAQIRLINSTSDILPRKHRRIETLDGRVELTDGGDEVGESLEDDEVGADRGRDVRFGAVVRDELGAGGHVDAVHVDVPVGGQIRES